MGCLTVSYHPSHTNTPHRCRRRPRAFGCRPPRIITVTPVLHHALGSGPFVVPHTPRRAHIASHCTLVVAPDRFPLLQPLLQRGPDLARRSDIHGSGCSGARARARARVLVPERLARHLPDFHERIEQRGYDERLLAFALRVLYDRLDLVPA